ncbi:MAG TPA: radical SAM protein [Armatimonadetes bacterium]|nr:radical SAM protein [Armatimonadota bacterium]
MSEFLADLENCQLCEWRCGVNRLAGERGVCRLTIPQVASAMLHPAPPSSYTIFMAGCNFKCLHCQNWDIAHWPDTGATLRGEVEPEAMAREGLAYLDSLEGQFIRADRLFFSGGESTCSLPYVEAVVAAARQLDPAVKVNFDTNGFLTEESLERVLRFTTSITYDLRAVNDEVHRALTGAPAAPVLRNAEIVAQHKEKLWEFRILVVPGVNEGEIEPLCQFLADLDPTLPVCFLAFRPNFVLEQHSGASLALMERAVQTARQAGLANAEWAGRPGLRGEITAARNPRYTMSGAQVAGAYAAAVGCSLHPRDCGHCDRNQRCPVKGYLPRRRT